MHLIYIFGITAIIGVTVYNGYRLKKNQFSHRFSTLVALLLKIDNKIKVEYKDRDSVTLSFFSQKGSLGIYCVRFRNIVAVEIEIITAKNHVKDYEWHFRETVDQRQMFAEIISYLLVKHKGHVLDQVLLQKVCTLHRANIASRAAYTKEYLADTVFCQAFKAMKSFDREEFIHFRTRFEMVFFNNVLLYWLLDQKGYLSIPIKEDIICLLIYYLENHSLLDKVENIEDFMEERFSLYTAQAKLLNTGNHYDFSLLYHLFFVAPLGTASKFKRRELANSNFKALMCNMIRCVSQYAQTYEELKSAG